MTETRKLAAILAADVVGYSRLTGANEDRTLARLRALRSDLIDPTISVHNGRVIKRTGDGALVEFRSVVDAVLRHRSDAWRKAQQRQHVGWTEAAGARGRMCSLCAGGANGGHKGEPLRAARVHEGINRRGWS